MNFLGKRKAYFKKQKESIVGRGKVVYHKTGKANRDLVYVGPCKSN
jgi:hypothetical protein